MARTDCPATSPSSMVTRARCVPIEPKRGISITPHVHLRVAKIPTRRSRRIRVWITIPETGHHVSRLPSLSLAGVPVKGKILDRQDETPLEHFIMCGLGLRVPEAFSPER